jgi:hypothetical protein
VYPCRDFDEESSIPMKIENDQRRQMTFEKFISLEIIKTLIPYSKERDKV